MKKRRLIICPYCGDAQPVVERCRSCSGVFESLSRQATHNNMGPWFIRDERRPFTPGCSYETMVKMIQRGRITRLTIVRGPTTRQFWTIAKRVPGLSHRLGFCYECAASVDPHDHACHVCGATFGVILDRNYLGLPEHRPMPWESDPPRERSEVEPIRPVDSMPEPTRPGEETAAGEDLPSSRGASSVTGGSKPRRSPAAAPEVLLPPPPPGRLSSFASNEELFSAEANMSDADEVTDAFDRDGPSGGSKHSGAGPAMRMTAAPGTTVAAHPRPDGTAQTADPAIDALRMRLDRQRRANRRLLWIMGALLLTTFGLLLLWAGEPSPTTPDSRALPGIVNEDPTADRESGDGPDDSPAEAGQPGAVPEPAKPAISGSELGSIREQFERAADDSRPLPDRIADAERAQRELREMLEGVDRGELDEEISALERAIARLLDQLRLREYFP